MARRPLEIRVSNKHSLASPFRAAPRRLSPQINAAPLVNQTVWAASRAEVFPPRRSTTRSCDSRPWARSTAGRRVYMYICMYIYIYIYTYVCERDRRNRPVDTLVLLLLLIIIIMIIIIIVSQPAAGSGRGSGRDAQVAARGLREGRVVVFCGLPIC